jgi:hypothetical protein
MGVGFTGNPSPGVQAQTLAISWNGTALSSVPSANPSGVIDEFGGVSCVSAAFCAAVGETGSTATNTQPLFETWNGSTWSTAPVANTAVILPASGTALSGTSAILDATASASAGVDSVQFVLTGGSYNQSVIGMATPTLYGYIFVWNTTGVPGGTYTLQSLVTDDDGNTAYSSGVSITVDNPPPTTSVLVPSNGASLSGTAATLDASASNATSVKFLLFGGIYGYAAPVVCTATLSYYGWLCSWNTTTVPDGSYALVSEASGPGGSAYSSGVSITVDNPPTTSVLVPSNGASQSGTAATLDASASNATSVKFLLFGGIYGYNAPVICTTTATYYGWLCSWDTTTVPSGSYALVSEASGPGGSAYSSGVSITVDN